MNEKESIIVHEFEKIGISNQELIIEGNYSDNLKKVLLSQEMLKKTKETDIQFSEPIIKQGENAVIFPHTINVIQGQAGVHKSRLVENICSAFLKRHDCNNELLGFKRTNFDAIHTVVYVDTERNLSEQLPYALQKIQVMAGYNKLEHPHNFEYISLLQIARKDRFATLKEYLDLIKRKRNGPLFIVLDVSTDCIEDFNKIDKSMELIDLMNIAINENNLTFLCVIHENPNSDKMRGHFGTELMNKGSTVMQVGFEKDGNNNDTELIRVKYRKCRSTAKHSPFYVKYCDTSKGLVLADVSEVADLSERRKRKASNEDMVELIEKNLGDGKCMPKKILIDELSKNLKTGVRTIESRLSELISNDTDFFNNEGVPTILCKETSNKSVFYKLRLRSPNV